MCELGQLPFSWAAPTLSHVLTASSWEYPASTQHSRMDRVKVTEVVGSACWALAGAFTLSLMVNSQQALIPPTVQVTAGVRNHCSGP